MPTPATTTTPGSASAETTFRSFSQDQGADYAQNRRDYHFSLYDALIGHHQATGGELNLVLDIGCGPGTAVRTLAPRFTNAIGLDPSEGMIGTARSLGGVSSNSDPIRFEISTAESLGQDLSPPVQNGSVDLIVAATAAHWFDMESFWPRAAQVLKPNGSVAIWSSGPMQIDSSTPNYGAIQAALDRFKEHLKDYVILGNRVAGDLYVDLPLPWTLPTPTPEFDEATFLRKEWKYDGEAAHGNQFYVNQGPTDVEMLEKILGTTSPVTRWREANPSIAGTEQDVLRIMRREMEAAMDEVGIDENNRNLKGGVTGVLLVVKKKA